MGLLLIFSIIFILVTIGYIQNDGGLDIGELIADGLWRLFVFFIVWGVIQWIGFMVISNKDINTSVEMRPLYIESAFTDKNWSLNGGFIVGVHGGSYTDYIVYGKFAKGLKRLELSADYTYIIEEQSTPRIKNYYIINTNKTWSHWLFLGRSETEQRMSRNHRDLIMVVPKNTVYKEFKLK